MTARTTATSAGLSTRERLSAEAARLFAERGYHGTSVNDLAVALGIQKSSIYAYINGKADLLAEIALTGAAAFHAALDELPDEATPGEELEMALRAHLGVVESQLDVATVWLQEWRYLSGEPRSSFVKERRRYERRIRDLFEAAVDSGELRPDLNIHDASLIFLSVGNWAYTWLAADTDVGNLTSRLMSMLLSGMGPERSLPRRRLSGGSPAHIISRPPATGTSAPVR